MREGSIVGKHTRELEAFYVHDLACGRSSFSKKHEIYSPHLATSWTQPVQIMSTGVPLLHGVLFS